jgi:hypothetical protein
MDVYVKNLVMNSLRQFEGATAGQKEIWIHEVREKIKRHENAIKHLGIGYSENTVRAARIFLRVVRKEIDDNKEIGVMCNDTIRVGGADKKMV